MEKEIDDPAISGPVRRAVFDPYLDFLIEHGDAIAERYGPGADPTGTFKPYTDDEVRSLLDDIARVGR